jgi:hypothetical protein
MFHMLTHFDLKPGVPIGDFARAISGLTEHLQGLGMAHAVGPISARQRDIPLDTDKERGHQYFVMMTFQDRQQAEAARAYLIQHAEPGESIHHAVYSRASNPIFTCWQDI